MSRWDWMKLEPKNIAMDVRFKVDGGDIRDEKLDRVAGAVVGAFRRACREQGVDGCEIIALGSVSPKMFSAWYRRMFKRELSR